MAAAYMTLMILYPTTNTVMAGLATVGMHLAVAAPLYWAPGYFLGDYRRLGRVLTILWALNGASALVGILQVHDPNRWMPAEFSSQVAKGTYGLDLYGYQGADGRTLIRPPGLGDNPGGACGAGLFVASVGLAYLGLPTSPTRKLLAAVMGIAGVTVILLTHVRSALLVLIGNGCVYFMLQLMQKRLMTAIILVCSIAGGGAVAFRYGAALGGEDTMNRFATLVEADPLTVYERSARLGMVTHALDTLLIDYPLGAGLGRWGMMRGYFGDENNRDSPAIWAEVQFASWVLDGGIVLLSLYLFAIAAAIHRLMVLSLGKRPEVLRQWAVAILMLSAGPVASIFSYTPFNAQMGMQFWFLIGVFEGVAQGEEQRAAAARSRPARGSLADPCTGTPPRSAIERQPTGKLGKPAPAESCQNPM